MTVSADRCAEIVHGLLGTCRSISDICTEEEQDDKDVLQAIDSELFLCACCEWWCEWSEMLEGSEDEPICQDHGGGYDYE